MRFKLLSLAAMLSMLSFTACKEVAITNPPNAEDCTDNIDNDGDGDIDCDDSDCDNVAACQISCGDDIKNGNEECDGADLGGANCTSEGFDGGTLDCANDCTFDTGGCFDFVCGNGVVDPNEECDDNNTNNLDGCNSACRDEFCGDGIDNDGNLEQCDDGAANSNTTPDACRTNCALPKCGDSVTDTGEGCDDGNLIDTDACRNNCSLPTCGDSIVQTGEQCDLGAANSNTGACTLTCQNPTCGDNFTQAGEQCDLGAANSNTGACTLSCQSPACGDGFTQSGEQCDLGAANSNTGTCTATCQNPICGDTFVQAGEQCDLGVANSNTGACTAACQNPICGDGFVQAGEQCDNAGANSNTNPNACRTDCTNPSCGDSVTDAGEGCDDGNNINTDACRNDCTLSSCGDGIIQAGEQCDLGVANSNTGACTLSCQNPTCGDTFVQAGEQCDLGAANSNTGACTAACQNATCGDGFVQATVEQCDNAGANSDTTPDACRTDCSNPSCGDAVVDTGEQCDDINGAPADGDGCNSLCAFEFCGDSVINLDNVTGIIDQCDNGAANSDTTPNACRADCTNPSCGDGVTDTGEGCDDGNNIDTDGCRNTCVLPSCGDGVLQAGEACDDSNNISGDGCSAVCVIEFCGDGIINNVNEQCDDITGTPVAGDGCSATCTFEFVCAANETLVQLRSTDTPLAINDDAGINTTNSVIPVVATANVKKVFVGLGQINEAFVGDLNISLISPSGINRDLSSGNGGTTQQAITTPAYRSTHLSDANATAIAGLGVAAIPFKGKFKPEQTLSGAAPANGFAGQSAAGNWTLRVVDAFNDAGTKQGDLLSWTLGICLENAPVCPNGFVETGEGCDDGNAIDGDGCTSCTVDANFACAGEPSVCVLNTCGNGVVDAGETCDDGNQVDGDGCRGVGATRCTVETGFACNTATPNVCTPICGDNLLIAGEECDDGNTANNDGCSSTCAFEFICAGNETLVRVKSTDVPKAIPDNNATGVTSNVTIANTDKVKKVFVGIGSITHTFDSDIDMFLVGPNAVQRELSTDNGAGGDNYISTLFIDGFPTLVTAGVAPFKGKFRPEQSLATTAGTDFLNLSAAGTWGLKVADDTGTDVGTINSWTLGICLENPPVCPNGFVETGETCDDNNGAINDGCNATCQTETGFACTGQPSVCAPICGDGIKTGAETCDDNNAVSNDGCSSTCQQETGFLCTGVGATSCQPICGDGLVRGAETCDDIVGTPVSGDGCSATCTVETGFTCNNAVSPSTCAAICGDGVTLGLETCDDIVGTPVSGDGCSNVCQVEFGFLCDNSTPPSTCSSTCGDGLQASDEGCDDGCGPTTPGTCDAGDNLDGCDQFCNLETCGNNILDPGETCDDDNQVGGDGCSSACTTETGFTCTGTGATSCTAICGDGLKLGAETCDDSNAVSNDGCSSTCQQETGFLCTGVGPTSCAPICGDGLVRGTEQCDDAPPAENGDGCSATCTIETGFACSGQPSVCDGICGDHLVKGGENCEDGNTTAGDGCSNTCRVEAGHFFEIDRNRAPNDVNDDGTIAVATNDFSSVNADGPFTASTIIHGNINPAGDDDVYAITNPTNAALDIRFDVFNTNLGLGVACGATIDTNFFVRNAAGTQLATNDDRNAAADRCSGLTLNVAANTTVFAQLIDFGDDGAINFGTLEDTRGYLLQVVIPICGNGIIDPGFEQCDDGNTTSGDGCNAQCLSTEVCGNGFVDPNEQCDDGNTVSGDGCSATCGVEITCGSGQTPVIVTNNTSAAITDNNTVNNFPVTVATTGGVRKVIAVIGNILHNADDQLDITLQSPLGTIRNLSDDNGTATGKNYLSAIIDDAATVNVTAGTAPFRGRFLPEQSMAKTFGVDFANQSAAGTWNLRVIDDTANTAGTFNSWTLALCVDAAAFCGDNIVQANEECDDGNAVDNDACSNLCQIADGCGDGNIDGTEFCDDGNAVSGDNCSSICQPDITCAAGQTPQVFTSTTSTAIPDTNVFTNFPLNVTAGGIKKAVVTLGSITHANNGHLDIQLQSPLTTVRNLSNDNGAGANYKGTILDDAAATLVTSGTAPFTGNFRPLTSISTTAGTDFLNQNANGTWNLQIRDDTAGTAGTLDSWALALCLDTVTFCGNGVIDAGEECDGNAAGVVCNAACQVTDGCGDGNIDAGETCDDNNVTSGDGCSGNCQQFDIACGAGETPVIVTNNTATTITDKVGSSEGVIASPITINTPGVVKKAIASIGSITHANGGHVDLSLLAPSGLQRNLLLDRGAGANLTATIFSDAAATALGAGASPFTGAFRPEQSLNTTAGTDFLNHGAQGTWALKIVDDTAGTQGTLNSWTLALCVNSAVTPTCGNGFVEAGEQCDDIIGTPVNGDGCSSTCQLEMNCTAGTETAVVVSSTDVPKAIPDLNATGIQSTINVGTSSILSKVKVVIGGIPHAFGDDLAISLISPLATSRNLSVAHGGANFFSTVLDDGAAVTLNATSPHRGRFRPDQTISGASPAAGFSGENASGAWKLKMVDSVGADSGVLQNWTLGVCVANATNTAPVANDQTVSGTEDTASSITLTATDAENNTLAFAIATNPANGTLSGFNAATGAVTYTPNANFNGSDSFTFTASDASLTSAAATVTINVAAVNDAPVANTQTVSSTEDTASNITLTATDIDSGTLTFAIAANPTNGTLSAFNAATGAVTYTPNANFNGADSFTFTANDGTATSAAATVTVNVAAADDIVVAVDDATTIAEDSGATTINVLANDTGLGDGGLIVTIDTPPTNGVASVNGSNQVVYTPNANFAGTEIFIYAVQDIDGDIDLAFVTVTVTGVNDAPTVNNGSVTVNENSGATTLTLVGADIDNANITFAIVAGPTNGTLGSINASGTSATVSYTPTTNFNGSDSFTFKANDGSVDSNTGTFSITITNVPRCGDGTVDAIEECDDTNAVAGDGCENNCLFTCASGQGPDRVTADTTTNHCYAAFDGDQVTFNAAQTLCAGMGGASFTGSLAALSSSTENTKVLSINNPTQNPWIGGTDAAVEGSFGWINGETFSFTNFAAGQPDDDAAFGGNGDCLHLVNAAGEWNDTNCNFAGFVTGFICEFVPVAGPTLSSADFTVVALGARVVLTGSGFTGATAVTIGGVAQSFVVDSNTQITVATVNNSTPIGATQNIVVTKGAASAPLPVAVIRLMINELDADSTGTDTDEYVEISTGVSGVSLAGYSLVFFNGAAANDASYSALDLNATADGNGLVLVGNATIVSGTSTIVPPITFADGVLQNGQDAVGIYQTTAASFPNGTAATSAKLIDSLVYDTSDADDTALLGVMTTDNIQVDEDGGVSGSGGTKSISRCNFTTRKTGASFITSTSLTPGAINVCP